MRWPGWTQAHGMARKACGAALMLAGLGLVATTARSLMLHRSALARHGGNVAEAIGAGPQAGMHGSMVRVSGPLQVTEPARDDAFNLSVNTPTLTRHVERFQWREIRLGNAIHYELDWSEKRLDAAQFARPAGHANPGAFPLSGASFAAPRVRLSGFTLSPPLQQALPGSMAVAPAVKQLPSNLAASFSAHEKYLMTSANPGSPRLGDLRVSWEAVPIQTITVFARLDGDQLLPAAHPTPGTRGYDLQIGDRTLGDLMPDVPEPPEMVWLKRVLAVGLGSLGAFALLWDPTRRWRDTAEALGFGTTAVGSVAFAQWLGSDVSMVLAWAAVAASGALLTMWRLRRRAR